MKQKSQPIQTGNAKLDANATRGWLIGHFIDTSLGLRHSDDVELKWGVLKAGDARTEWVTDEVRTTVGILISGKLEMEFRDKKISLRKPGDYIMWGEGTDHRWRALEDGVFITVRWPSINA